MMLDFKHCSSMQITTMQRDSALAILTQHRQHLRELGVLSLGIFGSVARDQAHAGSDVDILVELQSPVTFDQYMTVKFYLEDHLHCPVDLVTWRALKPQLLEVVEREVIYVP
jgi:predicted nucleotidyltransferase